MTARNERPATRATAHLDATGVSRRRFLALGLGAGLAAAGCAGGKSAGEGAGGAAPQSTFTGGYDGPKVDLAYWNGFTGGDGPFMRRMVQQFNDEHPNIVVRNNTVEWEEFYQRLPAAVSAGKGADVGVMHADQLATNAVRKVVVPLDDLERSLGLTAEEFPGDVWKAGIYQGSRYGIPLDVHCLVLYCNTDHLEKAGADVPTDAASYQRTCEALQRAGFRTPFWMPTQWPSHMMFLSLLWQHGGEPYAADGSRATFDSPAGVEALSWQVEQIKRGYSPRNVALDAQYVAFRSGKVSLTWDGIWQINDLESAKVPFRLAPLPTVGNQPAAWANSHHFFLTRQATSDANKTQAAKVFIDWMSRRSESWAGAGMIPARASARDSGKFSSLPQSAAAERIDTMRFPPAIPGLGDVQINTLEVAVERATLLKASPAAALREAAGNATELMQDNLEKYGG